MSHLRKLALFLICVKFSADCKGTMKLRSTGNQLMVKMMNSSCWRTNDMQKCLEQELIQHLDTILNTSSIALSEGVELVQTSALNHSKSDLSWNSINFSDVIWDKIYQVTSTRSIRIHLPNYQEGRGKKVQKQYVALGLLVAAVMATLNFQALSFLVGKAFMLSNIAILTAGFLAFKLLWPVSTMKNTHPSVIHMEPGIGPHFENIPSLRD